MSLEAIHNLITTSDKLKWVPYTYLQITDIESSQIDNIYTMLFTGRRIIIGIYFKAYTWDNTYITWKWWNMHTNDLFAL